MRRKIIGNSLIEYRGHIMGVQKSQFSPKFLQMINTYPHILKHVSDKEELFPTSEHYIHCVSKKNKTLDFLSQLRQIWTNFQNSFTAIFV